MFYHWRRIAWRRRSFWAFIFVFLLSRNDLFKSDRMCAIKNQFCQSVLSRDFFYYAHRINNLWSHTILCFAIKSFTLKPARGRLKAPKTRNNFATVSGFASIVRLRFISSRFWISLIAQAHKQGELNKRPLPSVKVNLVCSFVKPRIRYLLFADEC